MTPELRAVRDRIAAFLDAWGDEFDPYPRRELLTVNTGSEQWETLTTDDLRTVLAALDQQPDQIVIVPAALTEAEFEDLKQRFLAAQHRGTPIRALPDEPDAEPSCQVLNGIRAAGLPDAAQLPRDATRTAPRRPANLR